MAHFSLMVHGSISASIAVSQVSIISPVVSSHSQYPKRGIFSMPGHWKVTQVFSHLTVVREAKGSISSVAIQANVGVCAGSRQLKKVGVKLQAVHRPQSLAQQTFMVTNLIQCPVL